MVCAECGNSFDLASQFCTSCGTLQRPKQPVSYRGSLIFGVVAFASVLCWHYAASIPATSNGTAQTMTSVRLKDDAAALIANCGKPDVDHADSTASSWRYLQYKKARVTAMFKHEPASEPGYEWKSEGYRDSRTAKVLSPARLQKRLPCAIE
jgi:hypothetical protein